MPVARFVRFGRPLGSLRLAGRKILGIGTVCQLVKLFYFHSVEKFSTGCGKVSAALSKADSLIASPKARWQKPDRTVDLV